MPEQSVNGTTDPSPSLAVGPNGRGAILCPYCGHIQSMADQCERCKGLFEPLSRQATQNQMGPWQVRSEKNPFAPGCSYDKLKDMVGKGKINRATVVRGPSTRQFWSLACNTPGVAVLLGECHNCHAAVNPDDYMCPTCSAVLTCSTERQHLGLGPVKLLPGDAPPHEIASNASARLFQRPEAPAAQIDPPLNGAPSGPTIAARRRARRHAESTRALIAGAVILALIGFTVLAVKAANRARAPLTTTPPPPAETPPPRAQP